jgi:hypothetical protein
LTYNKLCSINSPCPCSLENWLTPPCTALPCRATGCALDSPCPGSDAEITVRIVDAEEGQMLNRDYRQKDYATNVLTFDYTQEPLVTADLVLCAPVVATEARNKAKRCRPTTPICWCMARCTPKAGTMKPANRTPKPWKRTKWRFWRAWGSTTPTEMRTCAPSKLTATSLLDAHTHVVAVLLEQCVLFSVGQSAATISVTN